MADIKERYGTEAEKSGDKQKIQSIWRFAPNAYDSEKIVVLPYCEYAPYAIASNTITSVQQWRLNSIFDPDYSGIGNQPLGRDTWSSIYNYYKVLETHIKYTVIETSNNPAQATPGVANSTAYPSLHGYLADISAAAPANSQLWLNASNADTNSKQQIFGPIVTYDINNGRGQQPLHFEYHWDASQFDTSIIDNSKNEWTAVGSDPSVVNYFSHVVWNPSGISRGMVIKYEIRYLVAFKQINRSLLMTVN